MGLIILLVIGAIFGWLSTIVLSVTARQIVIASLAVGIGGALVVGELVSADSLAGAISAATLLYASLAAVLALALYHAARRRLAG